MTPDELREHAAADRIDTVVVAFADHYGRLLGKRLDARHFCDEVLLAGTHACDYLLTTDMEMNPVAGYAAAGWDQGYGDHHVVPDLRTLRPAAWADAAAVVLADLETPTGPVEVAPRTVLRRQVERLTAAGYAVEAASELECFVVDRSYRDLAAAGHRAPDTGHRTAGWYVEDYHVLAGARAEPYLRAVRRSLARSEIPVEGTKGEAGRGQHELNVAHCDVAEMADRHALVKHAMKELADRNGLAVTFMAKPWSDDAGSSGHLHLSLWDAERTTNVFAGDGAHGESDVFRWFLGGWMAHLSDLMVCFAPTVNSYKRFASESWAPIRVAWARDNRTVGFRVVGHGPSLRIECRIPGADANPYLAYAAAIASGLAGIEQRREPPAEVLGDAYRDDRAPSLPRSLDIAAETFAASTIARKAFGDAVVDHYAHFASTEAASYRAAVTDWERIRYFERI